jgi:hypothetical protein
MLNTSSAQVDLVMSLVQPGEKHIVILVHGIRDYALWQTALSATLEADGFKVESTNYGRLNLFQFNTSGLIHKQDGALTRYSNWRDCPDDYKSPAHQNFIALIDKWYGVACANIRPEDQEH